MKARHGRLIKFLIAVAAIAAIAFLAAWVESIRRDAAYPGRRAVESVGTGAVALAARVSPEVVEEFRKLAERFGDFDYYQMQRAVSGLSEINVEDSSEFLQLFTEIDRGLELSNADGDFKCAPQPSGDDLFDLAANAIDQYLAAQQPKKL